MTEQRRRKVIVPQRELLLVEIERRCAAPDCHAKSRLGLTKAEALAYTGFECERCGRQQADALAERDIPEWWEELFVTNLDAVRGRTFDETAAAQPEPDEFVLRLSEEWRRARREAAMAGEGPDGGDAA